MDEPKNDIEPVEEVDGYLEPTTREEYVTLSCKAIETVLQVRVEMDVQMMTQADQNRLKRIMSKALFVLDREVVDMYDEHIGEDTEED